MISKSYEVEGSHFKIQDEDLEIDLEGEWESEEKEYFHNDLLRTRYCKKGDRLHGPSLYYGPSGQIISETWYFEGKKQGKLHRFYPNGAIYSVEGYRDGQPEGKHLFYFLDGSLKSEISYHNGLFHGETKLYWPDGTLKRSATFSNGDPTCEDRIYDEEGRQIGPTR